MVTTLQEKAFALCCTGRHDPRTELPTIFFFWGYVKVKMYYPYMVKNLQDSRQRIQAVVQSITRELLQSVWAELENRLDICSANNGTRFENLYVKCIDIFLFCTFRFANITNSLMQFSSFCHSYSPRTFTSVFHHY